MMIENSMFDEFGFYANLGLFASLGGLLGAAFFSALRLNVRLYLGTGKLPWSLALHVVRFGILGVFFWWAAGRGVGPLVASLAGFLVARSVVVHIEKLRAL